MVHFNSERFLGPHPDDLLNVALFGQTARQWRDTLPEAECKIRDHAHGNSVYSGTPRQTASEGKLSLFAEKVSKST